MLDKTQGPRCSSRPKIKPAGAPNRKERMPDVLPDLGLPDRPNAHRPEPQDLALLAEYAAGNRDAARQISQRFAPRIFAYATRMLNDRVAAEDVTQDALLRLWQAAPAWHSDGAPVMAWLYRVASNLCLDRLRRGKTVPLDLGPDPACDAPGAYAGLLQGERAAALQLALVQLPARQRQAVVLRHLEGLGNASIAQVMELSVEAVESLLARGKRALSDHLYGQRENLGFQDDR